ncbi:hypothetical protein MIMGU_mgv1a022711mg [Erythranthe guttata]|uniref:Uncharacterized protein n=1 Tax=Erythranthe guttata TaxID=4155 RepID=A0A022RZV3_ERYGU|nr:hypothetical protein MIMGU_mgv1a022711mg [Erythranthe guttata]
MDTLFRLVSLQQPEDQSFDSSRTSSSSRSSRQNPNYSQECFNLFMDDEDFSSSSSHHHNNNPYHQQHHQFSNTPTPTTTTSSTTTTPTQGAMPTTSSNVNVEFAASLSGRDTRWANEILLAAAQADADRDSARVQEQMWMLNEMSYPVRRHRPEARLPTTYQALFSRMTDSGERKLPDQDVQRARRPAPSSQGGKTVLKYQEVSPWTNIGHVACKGAIMEALEGEEQVHIIDIGTPTAPRSPPSSPRKSSGAAGAGSAGAAAVQKVMKEIGSRMEKFARLMGVPFKFSIIHHAGDLSELNLAELEIKEDEALAINCVGTLHSVATVGNRRDFLISIFKRLQPRIITIVEEEADLHGAGGDSDDRGEFVRGFQECMRWFRVYFDALDESFPRTSNERLMLERAAGRAVVDLVACSPQESVERRETAVRWSHRLHAGGFSPFSFNDEVCDDVRALLRRYKEGWSMAPCSDDAAGIFLSWKDQPVVWASAWKP